MARRWTIKEENEKRRELTFLYVEQNKTIDEVGKILDIAESSVFDRLLRLGIPSEPEKKVTYLNKRRDVQIPSSFTEKLAEFTGILLGDGHISPTQILVSFNSNEKEYLLYVSQLVQDLFHIPAPKYIKRLYQDSCDLYIGAVELVRFFKSMGLVSNKVEEQVDVPAWIQKSPEYQKSLLRGLFDTDGSIYKLRFGFQINLCNKSLPLLTSASKMLSGLGYHPSKISHSKIYLTRREELLRYVNGIGFGNLKHLEKAKRFGILSA